MGDDSIGLTNVYFKRADKEDDEYKKLEGVKELNVEVESSEDTPNYINNNELSGELTIEVPRDIFRSMEKALGLNRLKAKRIKKLLMSVGVPPNMAKILSKRFIVLELNRELYVRQYMKMFKDMYEEIKEDKKDG